MKIMYKLKDRKPFIKAMEEIMGEKSVYKKSPTFAYEVDYFTVTREGNLEFDDMADSEEIESVLEELEKRGFHAVCSEYDEPQPKIDGEEPLEDTPPAYGNPERAELVIQMPIEKVKVDNLTKLLEAKGILIKKALGIEATPIEIGEDKVSFPWFDDVPEPEETEAYTKFIAALCKMSVNAKRVTVKEKEVDNDKYAFRCFLLRLGFIGNEYKEDRKILLKNLTGSSAFKSGLKNGGDTQ